MVILKLVEETKPVEEEKPKKKASKKSTEE